jgi:replicative DNA helicase
MEKFDEYAQNTLVRPGDVVTLDDSQDVQDPESPTSRYFGHMRPIREMAATAYEELVKPYPSVKIHLWPNFTKATGGLRAREFTILCGATGTGKTTFLANLSFQLLMQKTKHFVASVETGATDFVKRVLSAMEEEDLNTGEPVPFERVAAIKRRWDEVLHTDNLILSLFDNRISLDRLLSELQSAHDVHGCKIAMLDNLNFFMEMTAEKNVVVEMDRTIHEIIMFCKRIDMHVIMVMHPKKTESGRVESEFDIKGSSTAVQEAHNVLLFNRPTDEDNHGSYPKWKFRELKFAKMRRRGINVGKRIMFENINSCYIERDML